MAFNKQQKISSYLSSENTTNHGVSIQPKTFYPVQPLMGQIPKGMFLYFFLFSFPTD